MLLLTGTALVFSNRGELESKYENYAAIMNAESANPFKTVEYYQAAAVREGTAERRKTAGAAGRQEGGQ